jgi:hypothetical protein
LFFFIFYKIDNCFSEFFIYFLIRY